MAVKFFLLFFLLIPQVFAELDCLTIFDKIFGQESSGFSAKDEDLILQLIENHQWQEVAWMVKEVDEQKFNWLQEKIEEDLKNAEVVAFKIKSNKQIGHSTEVFDVELKNGLKGIFKPRASDWKFVNKRENEHLSNYLAEINAYKISNILGMGLVPVTVERVIKKRTGALQVFIQKNLDYNWDFWDSERESLDSKMTQVFDYLIHNTDRHPLNFIPFQGRQFLIDHGSSMTVTGQKEGIFKPTHPQNMESLSDINGLYLSLRDDFTPEAIKELLKEKTLVNEVIRRREIILNEFVKRGAVSPH